MAGAWIEHATQGFSVPRSTTELPGQKVEGQVQNEDPLRQSTNYREGCHKVNEAVTVMRSPD